MKLSLAMLMKTQGMDQTSLAIWMEERHLGRFSPSRIQKIAESKAKSVLAKGKDPGIGKEVALLASDLRGWEKQVRTICNGEGAGEAWNDIQSVLPPPMLGWDGLSASVK